MILLLTFTTVSVHAIAPIVFINICRQSNNAIIDRRIIVAAFVSYVMIYCLFANVQFIIVVIREEDDYKLEQTMLNHIIVIYIFAEYDAQLDVSKHGSTISLDCIVTLNAAASAQRDSNNNNNDDDGGSIDEDELVIWTRNGSLLNTDDNESEYIISQLRMVF